MLQVSVICRPRVDVSSHKIGGKQTFGKVASDAWKKLMQMAEGPKAFLQGYEEMMEMYSNDPARKHYIKELFKSPHRHHFSRAIT